jgi:small GTP-binding protein
MNRKKVIGIFSHVDAGKTTLTEALLYKSGQISQLGNVNKGTTFFDYDPLERKRGITFLSKPISVDYQEGFTLIDTPGHMDLTFEMERSLQVTDLAIVLLSATEGTTGYTETIIDLCATYQVPLMVFINKCDLPTSNVPKALASLEQLDERFIMVGNHLATPDFQENWALLDDEWLNQMEEATVDSIKQEFSRAVRQRKIFPIIHGSAAQLEGIDTLLDLLMEVQLPISNSENIGQVYKILTEKGQRYHLIKVLSGQFSVKNRLHSPQLPNSEMKINQLFAQRDKLSAIQTAQAGEIVGVTGLSQLRIGDVFSTTDISLEQIPPVQSLTREPALEVQIVSALSSDELLSAFAQLEEEDPSLHVRYEEETNEVFIQVVGQIQMDYIEENFARRFNATITFSKPSVLYKETLLAPVRGNGHYEPLRHYAEVAFWMEPGVRGQGIVLKNQCSLEQLAINYQKGILNHLIEKTHRGVLIGAPLTDVTITLLAGIAHHPETKGGDFREATYRAVRQGLMKATSQLLEPWYQVKIVVPTDLVGKVVTDLQKYKGDIAPIEEADDYTTTIEGMVPVANFLEYPIEFASFTKNKGRLTTTVKGYYPCHNQADVLEKYPYNPINDLNHTPNSIFFAKGKGYDVIWDQVDEKCHIQLK